MTEKEKAQTNTSDDIMALIIEEQDPKLRAFLSVMNAFKGSLDRIQIATEENAKNIEHHEKNFDKFLESFKTYMDSANKSAAKSSVWRKVGAWGVGVGQLIVVSILTFAMSELRELKITDAILLARINVHETAIAVLQRGDKK